MKGLQRKLALLVGAFPLLSAPGCVSQPEGNAAEHTPEAAISAASTPQQAVLPSEASLMRRIGVLEGAVQGGGDVFVVAHLEAPHDIVGVFRNQQAALDRAAADAENLGAFGPIDLGSAPSSRYVPCPHEPPTEYGDLYPWQRPCVALTGIPALEIDTIADLTLSIRLQTGETLNWTFTPDSVDAIFFTYDAFERFLLPYYTWLHGPELAGELADSVGGFYGIQQER